MPINLKKKFCYTKHGKWYDFNSMFRIFDEISWCAKTLRIWHIMKINRNIGIKTLSFTRLKHQPYSSKTIQTIRGIHMNFSNSQLYTRLCQKNLNRHGMKNCWCKDLNECLFQTVTSLRKGGVRHESLMSTHRFANPRLWFQKLTS